MPFQSEGSRADSTKSQTLELARRCWRRYTSPPWTLPHPQLQPPATLGASPVPMVAAPPTTIVPEAKGVRASSESSCFLAWVLTGFGLIGVSRSPGRISTHRGDRRSHRSSLVLSLGDHPHRFPRRRMGPPFPEQPARLGMALHLRPASTRSSPCCLMSAHIKAPLLWGGIFFLVWITCKYLEDWKGFRPALLGHRQARRPSSHARFRHRDRAELAAARAVDRLAGTSLTRTGEKAFSPNSIEEWYLGEGREITDRSGLKFRTVYRDLFEKLRSA